MQEKRNDSEFRLIVTATRRDGRRRCDRQSKRELAKACLEPGVSLAGLALKHGVNANLLRKWVVSYQLTNDSAPAAAMGVHANAFVPVVLGASSTIRAEQHFDLQGFAGTLMTDGYSAWRTFDGVRHLGCFAHARRYFDEAAKAQGKADGRASQALAMIGRLYQVEALARGEVPAGSSRVDYTHAVRQQHSLPVLEAFKTWLDEHVATVLPKSLLGAAIVEKFALTIPRYMELSARR